MFLSKVAIIAARVAGVGARAAIRGGRRRERALVVKMTIKELKFRRQHIDSRIRYGVESATIKSLSWIRTTSQRSMRPALKSDFSTPGRPPRRHGSQNANLGHILFDYNRRKMEGIVGPIRFRGSSRLIVPRSHEHSSNPYTLHAFAWSSSGLLVSKDGTVARRKRDKRTGEWTLTNKRRSAKVAKWRTSPYGPGWRMTIRQRRFMLPALMKAIEKGAIDRIFRQSIGERRSGKS